MIAVVVPVDGPTSRLRESLRSVLCQSLRPREIIVAEPSGSAETRDVIRQCGVSEIRHLVAPAAVGLWALIRAGVETSCAPLVALLEPGSCFHPEKLVSHWTLMRSRGDVEASCNGRFECDGNGNVLDFWRPPVRQQLFDLMPGCRLTASEMVLRRDVVLRHVAGGGVDLRFGLALSGVSIWGVREALNSRIQRSRDEIYDVAKECDEEVRQLESVMADSRFPPNCRFGERAVADVYLNWSHEAFLRGQVRLGRELLRRSIRLDRRILDMEARGYLEALVDRCVRESVGHEERVAEVLRSLPPELAWITKFTRCAIARSHVERGTLDVIWCRADEGRRYLEEAASAGARLDERYWYRLLQRLHEYEVAWSDEEARLVIGRLCRHLSVVATSSELRRFKAVYFFNQALRRCGEGKFANVPGLAMRAAMYNPTYLGNRGLWSVLMRSMSTTSARRCQTSAAVPTT
jgi:hypothetical protein